MQSFDLSMNFTTKMIPFKLVVKVLDLKIESLVFVNHSVFKLSANINRISIYPHSKCEYNV